MAGLAFDTVALIGVGLLGGSYGLALKERGLARKVVGVPRSQETIRKAMEVGAIDEGGLDAVSAVSGAELVILATPVQQMPDVLRKTAGAMGADCIVSDAGSSKAAILDCASSLGLGRFVGGHPMAGSEKKGVEFARADLFVGATYFLTPTDQTEPAALSRMEELAVALGAEPVVLPPDQHDRIVALTSHLPHLVAASLVRLAAENSQAEPLTRKGMATGFRDVTRVASGDVEMWRDIYLSNGKALLEALERMEGVFREARALLEKGDAFRIAEWLSEAKKFRDEAYGTPDAPGRSTHGDRAIGERASST